MTLKTILRKEMRSNLYVNDSHAFNALALHDTFLYNVKSV